jgi:hypothetical protein
MSHLRLSESKTQSLESIEESLRPFRLNDDDKENDDKENDDKENDDKENDETEREREKDDKENNKTENDDKVNDKTENDVSEIVAHTKKFLEVFFLVFLDSFLNNTQ